jgi:hypothetical protein
LTIRAIKDDIRRRAAERQARIARGEHDVPIHYEPLPLASLLDVLSQLEYRRDFLDLAVPPPGCSLREKFKRFFKKTLCTSLRWLLIRQVEFNTIALRHAHAEVDLVTKADQNLGELLAALTAMKLQLHTLTQRIIRLETRQVAGSLVQDTAGNIPAANAGLESFEDKGPAYQAYLHYLKDQGDVLLLESEREDFLKLLLSEGLSAQGVEADPVRAEYYRECELPVICAEGSDYLGQRDDASVGAIYLGHRLLARPPRELAQLAGQCWTKLKKGGVLIAEAWNPLCPLVEAALSPNTSGVAAAPVELVSFIFENQCFAVVDYVFSLPINPECTRAVRTSAGKPFDRKQYRDQAIVGRK